LPIRQENMVSTIVYIGKAFSSVFDARARVSVNGGSLLWFRLSAFNKTIL
jgi:hypothetical protein